MVGLEIDSSYFSRSILSIGGHGGQWFLIVPEAFRVFGGRGKNGVTLNSLGLAIASDTQSANAIIFLTGISSE